MGFQRGNRLGGRKRSIGPVVLARVIDPWVPAILARLKEIALSGEDRHAVPAAKELLDRCHGKSKESIEMRGNMAITVNIGEKKAPTES